MTAFLCTLLALTPQEARVRLDAAGLQLDGRFTDADVLALAQGLDALPIAYRQTPSRPVKLVLNDALPATPSGIAEPEWQQGAFVLTRQEGHVNFRDRALDDDARRALWRQRATVHVLLALHDEAQRWSQQPLWRRTNGWLLPFERPLTLTEHALNQAATAYTRPRGRASARLDFLTFAESALVPVTALAPDDLLRCQDFSRLRALHTLLGVPWEPGPCPAFDAWLREDSLSHLEVLLVQQSGRAAESLFGHVLLRPVWKDHLGPGFDTVIQFAAITFSRAGPVHLINGMFGGYSLGVFTVSQTDLEREKLSGEQRGMTRWRLNLSRAEQRRLMERSWEWERRGRFSYAFFSDNCATLLIWMLESTMDEGSLVSWPAFITAPAAVLDDFYRARRSNGQRLMQQVFPSFEATSAMARRDDVRRRELEAKLPIDFQGVRDDSTQARQQAYRRVAQASSAVPVSMHEALFVWWALSARVERSVADAAKHEWRELEETLVELPPSDLDALWNERLAALEQETLLQQRIMVLDRAAYLDDIRRNAKRRAMTAAESAAARDIEARLALFDEVTTLQGELTAGPLAHVSATAFLEEAARLSAEAEQETGRWKLPVSGHYRASAGVGVWRKADGTVTPVVRFESAGLKEAIGAERSRAIGEESGVRLLEGGLTIAPGRQLPEVVQSHFTLISLDTLAPPRPPAPLWQHFVGFGFELGTDFRAWRSQPLLAGAAGWGYVHLTGPHARNFIALGAGPAAHVALNGRNEPMPVGGVTTRALARVALSPQWPSALRLDVRHQSVWGPWRVLHELRGDLSIEWVLAWGGRPRLIVQPTASLTAEPSLQRLDFMALVLFEPVESVIDLVRR